MSDMASRFIDNELNVNSKHEFVTQVHDDPDFYRETLDLLEMEMLLRGDVAQVCPDPGYKEPLFKKRFLRPVLRPLAYGLAGAFSVVLVVWMTMSSYHPVQHHMNRFVIYLPEVSQVEIAGSFTEWQRIPLKALGESGYWEISLDVPSGVHRYTYILGGDTLFADPTILAVEHDDFGGINSILTTES